MVNWTENRLQRLRLLHHDGLSASAIAKKLGPAFTKSIVLHKLRSIEAERRRQPKIPAPRKAAPKEAITVKQVPVIAVAKPPPRAMAAPAAVVVTSPAKPSTEHSHGTTLLNLRSFQCRWPLDESGPARLFCGSQTIGATSWCEHHQRIAFTSYGRPGKAAQQRGK